MNELIFVTDARFYKSEDGKYYAGEMSFSNTLWERYLKYFSKVTVIARVFEKTEKLPEDHIVNIIDIKPIAAFDSILSYIKLKQKVDNQMSVYLSEVENQSVIIRGAGTLGYLAAEICRRQNIAYGIEVIGDPHDVFAPGVIRHPLRPLLRVLFTNRQKKAVHNASSVIYVTKSSLQKRYPAHLNAFSTFASDVFVDTEKVVLPKKMIKRAGFQLISIGALDQLYKSPDIAIKVVAELAKRKIDAQLTWLGKGIYMDEMKKLAEELNVENNVYFVGSVSSNEVITYLDQSDIFLLLSQTEGLPRAIVEAMSRGLPCIGTNVGGIPELIKPEFLVPTNNVEDVCNKIELLISNQKLYEDVSTYNINFVKEYDYRSLENKRMNFYKSLIADKQNSNA